MAAPIEVAYFSDILCIWAYAAEARLRQMQAEFTDRVALRRRYCAVFADSEARIAAGWAERGGHDGFAAHQRQVAALFDHVEVSPKVWSVVRPPTSTSAHMFLKAADLVAEAAGDGDGGGESGAGGAGDGRCGLMAWELRSAFFRDARDIARFDVLTEIAAGCGFDPAAIRARVESGEAAARLAGDQQEAERVDVRVSPTLVLNEGRQKLQGNVGYRIIQANIHELLSAPAVEAMSWC